MRVSAILLAAGASTRMGQNKMLLELCGKTPVEHCLDILLRCKTPFSRIVITVSEQTEPLAQALCAKHPELEGVLTVLHGGAERGESVLGALRQAEADIVVIQDCARCLTKPELIDQSIESAARLGSGIAGVYARDTVRRLSGEMLDRSELFITQTPQTFSYPRILRAYEDALTRGVSATDDCALYERLGYKAAFVQADITNQKLTFVEDIPFFEAMLEKERKKNCMRIGYGEDTHRLVEGRKLILGGVHIPFHLGLLGHSDADVLTHAVMDALLGAAGLDDIGTLFPDTSPQYEGANSLKLLKDVAARVRAQRYTVINIDAVIIAQEPKLMPYKRQMCAALGSALGDEAAVNIKATTPEHTGPEGNLECISARCVCLLEKMC